MRVRSAALFPFLLLALGACSSSSSGGSGTSGDGPTNGDGGPTSDVRPSFAASTDLGTWGTDYASLALDRTGRAAVARLSSSDPAFQLFDGTSWGKTTKLACCSGPYALSLSVDSVNRFWVTDTSGGFVTFDVAETGVSAFHAAKTTTPVGGSYYYPAVTTLADGRVRYAIPTESSTIALFESDAALSKQRALGSAGTFQSDTSQVSVRIGGSTNGSVAVHWPARIENNTTYSYKMDFYEEGRGWDGESAAPSGFDLVSFTVGDDGHALALWENGRALAVSVRDPAAKKFGAPKPLVTRDFDPGTIGDPSLATAWLAKDGSFTVVVPQLKSVKRWSIAADGTIGAPVVVHAFDAPADASTPVRVGVAERGGARFVTWRAFGASPALFGAFVDGEGAWSDAAQIAAAPADYRFRWTADLASDGRAIALVEPLDQDLCETPALRHYTPSLGWGDLALESFDGCVAAATAAIADDGTVSLLVELGKQPDDKRVKHAVAR